jgi:hypothetical protein
MVSESVGVDINIYIGPVFRIPVTGFTYKTVRTCDHCDKQATTNYCSDCGCSVSPKNIETPRTARHLHREIEECFHQVDNLFRAVSSEIGVDVPDDELWLILCHKGAGFTCVRYHDVGRQGGETIRWMDLLESGAVDVFVNPEAEFREFIASDVCKFWRDAFRQVAKMEPHVSFASMVYMS